MRRSWRFVATATLVAIPMVAHAATEIPVRVTKGPEEQRPAVSEWFLAWSQVPRPGSDQAAVYAQGLGGSPFRVNSRGSLARMGGLDGTRLVFSQYSGLDKDGDVVGGDLRLVDLATRSRLPLPDGLNTKKEEYGPSISGDWLLFGRASTGGRFRNQLLLRNLLTGEARVLVDTKRPLLASGQVNGGFAVWHSCGRHGPCDVFRYDIGSGETLKVPNPSKALQYSPGVSMDGTVYFSRSGFGCGTNAMLQRWTPAGGTSTVVDFPSRVDADGAYVYDDPDSGRQILYSRTKCLKDKNEPSPRDLYEIIE